MLNGVPRILIIRLSAIGDVVRALPALAALRRRFPHAQIDWAVESKAAAIVEDHPDLDLCHVFERRRRGDGRVGGFFAFLRFIRRQSYDVTVDFHGIFKSGLISLCSRAPQRFGFASPRSREMSSFFYTDRVSLPSMRLNRVDENRLLCEALGAAPHEAVDAVVSVPEAAQAEVDAFFDTTFDGSKRVVAIHPAVERESKQWPLASYAALADLLLADGRFEVVITWGPDQRAMAEAVAARAKRKPLVAPETPDLKHYAWLIHRCALYVGGDTGPMHMAAAMGTSVVAIFGGTDPAKHAPVGAPARVLYAGPEPPPRRVSTRAAQEYLARITPEMVYDACVGLLMRQEEGLGAAQRTVS